MEIPVIDFEVKKIDYRILKPLQGKLKDLNPKNYERLKKSFREKGIFVPIIVWKDGEEFRILDGHGREKLFSQEKASFIDASGKKSYEVPCLVIPATHLQDAKEKLLIISSQYQSITQEGLEEFAIDLSDDWLEDTVNFDAIFNEEEENEEKDDSEADDSEQFLVVVECRGESQQKRLYEELQERGFACKLIM